MGLRTQLRTATALVATTVVAALLTAPSATARPCANCEDPDLPPGGGGPACPTIAATTDPYIQSPVGTNPAKVGGTVTARTGIWNSNTDSMTAIWYVGSQPTLTAGTWSTYVANRTVSYTITPGDVGKPIRLWVRGIGTDTQCYKSEYSDATAAVVPGDPPVPTTQPSIAGELSVGSSLTALPGAWTRTAGNYSYVWRWADGTHRGAGPTYTLGAGDLGKRIRLTVTNTVPGYQPGSAEATTASAITAGPALVANAAPVVTGTPVFGQTLSADEGTWSPVADGVEHQWVRDGTAIAGATEPTYTVGLADIGAELSLTCTARKAGYADGTTTTTVGTVRPAAAPVWTGGKVRLRGKDRIGKKIKPAVGTQKLRRHVSAPDARVGYQWLRNGKAIKKSAKKAHRITRADVKKRLKVRITIDRPGHRSLVITTKAVKIKNSGRRIS